MPDAFNFSNFIVPLVLKVETSGSQRYYVAMKLFALTLTMGWNWLGE
jgi:hypothetical protein